MASSNRYKCYVILILAFLLFLSYTVWSAIRLKGITPLIRGYCYWRTDAGVIIKLADAGATDSEIYERLSRQIERDERDFGEVRGTPKVGPDVDGYHVYRRIIVGHALKAIDRNAYGDRVPVPEPRPAGYFIIDTRIDRVYDGLSKQEWLRKLCSFGINREPMLYSPSIYDELLGRNKPAR